MPGFPTFSVNRMELRLHRTYRSIALLTLLVFAGSYTLAQIERAPIEAIQIESGLSEGTIWAIEQDQSGFVWVATSHGLNRFDGYQFKVFRADGGPTSIAGNVVRALLFRAPRTLWVGTSNGLSKFNTETETCTNFRYQAGNDDSLPGNYITCLEADDEGQVWVGTRSGVAKVDQQGHVQTVMQTDKPPNSLLDDQVRAIFVAPSGHVWIGTDSGVHRWDARNDQLDLFKHDVNNSDSLGPGEIKSLHGDNLGIYVGSSTGLYRFEKGQQRFTRIPMSEDDLLASPYWVNALARDRKGNLWVATREDGIRCLNRRSGEIHGYRQDIIHGGLPSNNLLSLKLGQSDLLWIGTYKAGLAKLDLKPRKFKSYFMHPVAGVNADSTTALLRDSRDGLWLGTQNGVIHQTHSGTITHFHDKATLSERLSGNQILSLLEDDKGQIWIGTYASGLNIYSEGSRQIRHYQKEPDKVGGLPHDIVKVLVKDAQGQIYVGSRAGLHLFDELTGIATEVPIFTPQQSVSERRILAFRIDSAGIFWVGTNGGLYRYDPNNESVQIFRPNANSASISHNEVTAILEDDDGHLWVGTSFGLNILRKKVPPFEHLFEGSRLRDSTVHGLAKGAGGDIWVSSNRGLTRLRKDGQNLHYDYRDGLQSNEFLQSSVTQDEQFVYFGGTNGYSKFDPNLLNLNPNRPKVRFTSFRIFENLQPIGQRLNDLGELVISHRETYISFEFSALEHTAPGKNLYEYQLVGSMDEAWQRVGKHRHAVFTNLQGGLYTLRVRATNNDGLWGEVPAELRIRVLPPWWQAAWVAVVALLFLIASILSLHAWHVRAESSQHRRLSMAIAERSESLTESHQQLIEEAQKAGIGEMVTGLLHNLGNIMTSVIISAEEMVRIIQTSKSTMITRVSELAEKNRTNLHDFLTKDTKGSRLPVFLSESAKIIRLENDRLRVEGKDIEERVALMLKAIQTEQDYAQEYEYVEAVEIGKLVEDTLQMFEYSFNKRGLDVIREFSPVTTCRLNPYKMIHILANLIKNAADAIHIQHPQGGGCIRIVIEQENNEVVIAIYDNGCGISPHLLEEIYSYGFSTKSSGHGFGLYSCRISMTEMGGSIDVHSDGVGKGSIFEIRAPVFEQESSNDV